MLLIMGHTVIPVAMMSNMAITVIPAAGLIEQSLAITIAQMMGLGDPDRHPGQPHGACTLPLGR